MPRSVTMRSRTRTRCSRRSVWAAYCAAFSATICDSSSIWRSLSLNQGRRNTPPKMASSPQLMPRIGMRRGLIIGCFLSVRVAAERLDLAVEAHCAVGDDALDIGEAVLDRAELGAELGILLAEQPDALHRLVVALGVERLAPAVFQRVAILDAQPGGEDPARHRHRD